MKSGNDDLGFGVYDPRFQDALKAGRNETIAFYVFDLLHLNGYDVKPLPLLQL